MNIYFTQNAWEEFNYWLDTDTEIADKIRGLIKEIQQSPFKGTGKPEALKHELQGLWSRRITREHRLVYKVADKGENKACTIVQCRFHYDD